MSSLMRVKPEERKLSLDDVQGTFLLLGAGFAIGFFALFLEFLSWLYKQCLRKCSRYTAKVADNQENDVLFLNVPGHHWKSYSLNDLALRLRTSNDDEPEIRTMPDLDVPDLQSPSKVGICKTDKNILSEIPIVNVCGSINNLQSHSPKNLVNAQSNRRGSI